MAISISLVKTSSGIEAQLSAIVERGKNVDAFLNRVTFNRYKQAQLDRWQSENATQVGQTANGKALSKWDPLTEPYRTRKLKRYANSPGAGRAVMIATGALYQAASGAGSGLNKVTTQNGIEVRIDSSSIPYAPYPGLRRPFMQFNQATEQEWVDEVVTYLMTGEGE